MKWMKHIALSTFVVLSVFGVVLYTSCTKNACSGVTCLHGSICSGGMCVNCPDGVGGNNCETAYRDLFINTYGGNAIYTHTDTSYIVTDTLNTLAFTATPNDSNYLRMQITWTRPGKQSVFATIILDKTIGPTGATFSFEAPPVDTFSYSGTGTVNANTASLNLTEKHPHSAPVVVTLSNFIKKQ